MSHSLFFFNDTATTEIYTLSLHDALPIYKIAQEQQIETERHRVEVARLQTEQQRLLNQTLSPEALMKQWIEVLHDMKNSNNLIDRKSTRLNSSHGYISYAVFCLKKKTNYD